MLTLGLQDVFAEQDGVSLSAGPQRDESVIYALTELAESYPRYGFKMLFQLLYRQGNT